MLETGDGSRDRYGGGLFRPSDGLVSFSFGPLWQYTMIVPSGWKAHQVNPRLLETDQRMPRTCPWLASVVIVRYNRLASSLIGTRPRQLLSMLLHPLP